MKTSDSLQDFAYEEIKKRIQNVSEQQHHENTAQQREHKHPCQQQAGDAQHPLTFLFVHKNQTPSRWINCAGTGCSRGG